MASSAAAARTACEYASTETDLESKRSGGMDCEGLIWSNPQTYAQPGSGTPTRGVALLQPLCSEEPTRSL